MKNPKCCEEMADYDNLPHVSLVIPFEPKMNNKSYLEKILTAQIAETEKSLLSKYESKKVMPVLKKLKALLPKIDHSTEKSIAIFVSSSTEKVIYFNHSDYLENHPYPKL